MIQTLIFVGLNKNSIPITGFIFYLFGICVNKARIGMIIIYLVISLSGRWFVYKVSLLLGAMIDILFAMFFIIGENTIPNIITAWLSF